MFSMVTDRLPDQHEELVERTSDVVVGADAKQLGGGKVYREDKRRRLGNLPGEVGVTDVC
jgi:hypothetical protein